MVLSSCSNWGTTIDVQTANNFCEPMFEAQQQQQQLEYYLDYPLELPNYAFFDHPYNNCYFPETYPPLLPYFPSPFENEATITNIVPYEEEDFCSYPIFSKRQKIIENPPFCSDLMPAANFFDNSFLVLPEEQSIINHQVNNNYSLDNNGINECNEESSKKKNSEKCSTVSAQSIAARARRRKITEKTQELGKLVPGGNKMNTAEMLQSAFKYIKYLQAQVGILQFMDSFQETEKESCKGNMEILTSPKLQEKLYMEEKCLVPKDFVLSLTTISKAPLSDELSQLLEIV
ncbi:hypothetical protein CCACVL1_06689 [Corchorus capsularis]|uniref:BHLH domain-containing protein n=1 Tax=Corchorus capsularis TaxID=210143 RepID=A0A1R3JDV6_COCAP|nr:hypothetical protein CCACVL1_06689 [Corchorus capsularis]